jgi:hypothetical protein
MVISDSQTTTAEAAILGVPSIRYNLFVGRLSYLEELEKKYMLTYGFTPGQENQMITKIRELLLNPHVEEEWRLKRNLMLSEKTDLNEWMINYFHSLI